MKLTVNGGEYTLKSYSTVSDTMSGQVTKGELNSETVSSDPKSTDVNFRLKAGIFLTAVTGASAAIAFAATLASAKKRDPTFFQKGVTVSRSVEENGVHLALRALKWGTIYAVSGFSIFCYGVWKVSGANNLQEFRHKMGEILPRIPKNNPPQGRTEFEGLTDLLKYITNDYAKDSPPKPKS